MVSFHDYRNDPKWREKRKEIILLHEVSCSKCGAKSDEEALHVDPCYYEEGMAPWEYPDSAYRCLCEDCRDVVEDRTVVVGLITSDSGYFDDTIYGYALGYYAFMNRDKLLDVPSHEIAQGLADYWGLDVEKHVIPHLMKHSARITGQQLLQYVFQFGTPCKPWLERIAKRDLGDENDFDWKTD